MVYCERCSVFFGAPMQSVRPPPNARPLASPPQEKNECRAVHVVGATVHPDSASGPSRCDWRHDSRRIPADATNGMPTVQLC